MAVYSDISLLHPKFRLVCARLAQQLEVGYKTGKTQTLFKVYETFRDPMRQSDLLSKHATKAGPFESGHNFGLAADFVPYIDAEIAHRIAEDTQERVMPGWNWWSGHDWEYLAQEAHGLGLVTISWDRSHVQHPHAQDIIMRLSRISKL